MLRDDGKIVAFLRYKCLVKPLGNLKGYLTHFAVLQGVQASFESEWYAKHQYFKAHKVRLVWLGDYQQAPNLTLLSFGK